MTRHFTSRRMFRCVAVIAFVAACAATQASAQSLGDVARKEESRRQNVSGGKVYTNASLPVAAPATEAAPAAAAPAAEQAPASRQAGASTEPASGAKKDEPKKDEPKKDEAWWRARVKAEREALSRAESFAEALQSRINALSTDFANRDDPAQRNVIAGDRQKALSELDRVRKEIQEHTKGIADIQQEARRAGVPAAWTR